MNNKLNKHSILSILMCGAFFSSEAGFCADRDVTQRNPTTKLNDADDTDKEGLNDRGGDPNPDNGERDSSPPSKTSGQNNNL